MRTSTERVQFESGEPQGGPGRYILGLAWALVRAPVAALLAICEPLVRVILAGLALLFGVDRFMSEARALTNLIGNGVATVAIARWEGSLDKGRLRQELNPAAP